MVVLSRVPERKKAAMHLPKKRCVLGKLHSRMSCIAVGHEFNVDESTHISNKMSFNRRTHKPR